MKRSFLGLTILTAVFLFSCGDGDDPGPIILEPITFIQPDTPTVWGFPASTVNIETQLTTDRIIDSLIIKFHIDSTGQGYDPDADPLYIHQIVKWPIEDNIQIYQGTYTIPPNLKSFDAVRLIFVLRAKERIYQKTLKINVL